MSDSIMRGNINLELIFYKKQQNNHRVNFLTSDTLKLLQVIEQYMYLNGSEELHTIHNQFMSSIRLFWMRQGRGQSVQNFRDQFTVMRHVCEQLGLTIGQSEQGERAVLKIEGVTNPITEQLKQAKEKTVEELFAILFVYMVMLEDVVHFPKSQYLTKMTSPYLLKTTSPIESNFNKVDMGKVKKPLTVM